MRPITRIYLHCTASQFGDLKIISGWHEARGFAVTDPETQKVYNIGYHYLILNQFKDAEAVEPDFSSMTDGLVVPGRPEHLIGAHVKDANSDSIGIAYVGFTPTPAQYFAMLNLCKDLIKKHNLTVDDVYGHHEYYIFHNHPIEKTCPNFNMNNFRSALKLLI